MNVFFSHEKKSNLYIIQILFKLKKTGISFDWPVPLLIYKIHLNIQNISKVFPTCCLRAIL